MPIPDYQSLMLPVLRFAGDRKTHSVAEFRQRMSGQQNEQSGLHCRCGALSDASDFLSGEVQ